MHPYPAQVVSPRYDIVGWNRAQAALMGDYSKVPARYRNILWLLFTQPAWRDLIVEQDDVAYVVARFRANMAEHVGEPAWMELVRELSEVSPRFVELWERHDVATGTGRVKQYLHPQIGLIRLVSTALTLSDRPGFRIVAGTPADEESRAAMLRLADLGPWEVDWVLPELEPDAIEVPAAVPVA
jgi:hypothetical protein